MANYTNIVRLSNLDQIQSRSYMRVLLCIRFPTAEVHFMYQGMSRMRQSVAILLSCHPYLAGRVRFSSESQRFALFWSPSDQVQNLDEIISASYYQPGTKSQIHETSNIPYSYGQLREAGFPLSRIPEEAVQPCPSSPDLVRNGALPFAIKATFIDGGVLLAVYVLPLVMDGQAVCSLLKSLAGLNEDTALGRLRSNERPNKGSPEVRTALSHGPGLFALPNPKCAELRIMSDSELRILETRLKLRSFRGKFQKPAGSINVMGPQFNKNVFMSHIREKDDFGNSSSELFDGGRIKTYQQQAGTEKIRTVVFALAMSRIYLVTQRIMELIPPGDVMPSVHDVLLAILWVNITRARHHMRKWVHMPATSKLVFSYNARAIILNCNTEWPFLGNASVYVVAELPTPWLADPLTTGSDRKPSERVSWWARLAHISQTIRLAILAVDAQYVHNRVNVVNQASLLASILPDLKLHDGLDFLISSWASAALHEQVPWQFSIDIPGLTAYLQKHTIPGGFPIEAVRRIGEQPEDGMCFIMPPHKSNRAVKDKSGTIIRNVFQRRAREEIFQPIDSAGHEPHLEGRPSTHLGNLQPHNWVPARGGRSRKTQNANWILDIQVQLDDHSMTRLCNSPSFTNMVERIVE